MTDHPLTRGERRSILRSARSVLRQIDDRTRRRDRARAAVEQAYAICVAHEAEHLVLTAPIEALEPYLDSTRGLSTLRRAGYRTVGELRGVPIPALERVDGVGPTISAAVAAAVEYFVRGAHLNARVRIDASNRTPDHGRLVDALSNLRHARADLIGIEPPVDALRPALRHAVDVARRGHGVRRLFTRSGTRAAADAALIELETRLATVSIPARAPKPESDHWEEFGRDAASFMTLLAEVAGLPDADAAHGHLSEDLIERINSVELRLDLLRATLRGYQSFGAKFALAQVRGIVGDEMGLGKTMQALALLCHLRIEGHRHFLVVSPASVLANWEHEIRRHTKLDQVLRLHGPDRAAVYERWKREGGVALTTFGTLPRLQVPPIAVAAVIVDEAHYVKNPDAQRTQAVERWLTSPSYALLLTGTPMENRPEEFRSLVDLVRPDVAHRLPDPDGPNGAAIFRQAVAPAYLRRNQADVLTELPERIEVEEWLTLEGPELDAYRDAVASRNFMAMRRAAFLTVEPRHSSKLNRVVELVHEAGANGRKVVVFSYFREVIDRVEAALGPWSMGQITGSVTPGRRQEIVDAFTASHEPGALVCQIQAAGVGMNMQAASVVILTEPQWKPSSEEQAIARCHRMGQARSVDVHRLLTEGAVDEHMVAVLARKGELFDQFVRRSNLKDAAPEAVEAGSAEQLIITREIERLELG